MNCSTLAVVGRPWPVPVTESSPTYPLGIHANYAVSKLAGEIIGASLAGNAGLAYINLRFSSLFGVDMAWHGVLPRFIDLALSGGRPTIHAGGAVYADFLHVRNAARAVVAAINNTATGIINVASGLEFSLAQLAECILNAAGRAKHEYDIEKTGLSSRAIIDIKRMKRDLKLDMPLDHESDLKNVVDWRRATINLE